MAAAVAWPQSTTTTYSTDLNGNRVADQSFTAAGTSTDGERTERFQSINGRQVPLEQVINHVVRDDASGKVTERIVRRFTPTGQSGFDRTCAGRREQAAWRRIVGTRDHLSQRCERRFSGSRAPDHPKPASRAPPPPRILPSTGRRSMAPSRPLRSAPKSPRVLRQRSKAPNRFTGAMARADFRKRCAT